MRDIIVDCATGARDEIVLTPAEVAAIEAQAAADAQLEGARLADEQAQQAAVVAGRLASRIATIDKVRAEELDDDTVALLAPLFDPWQPGLAVEVGDVLSWDGTLVECIQAHTTQSDWDPGVTPALWKVHRTTTGSAPDEWVQPTGGHDAYNTGDRVTFEGQVYESLIGANVWSPTGYPAGWTLIP